MCAGGARGSLVRCARRMKQTKPQLQPRHLTPIRHSHTPPRPREPSHLNDPTLRAPRSWISPQTKRARPIPAANTTSRTRKETNTQRDPREEHRTIIRHDKTRQQLRSESKQLSSQSITTKKCLSLLESKHLSERDGTLQCSAGPEWYGCHGTFSTMDSTRAPAVGRPSESAWCLAARKKKTCHQSRRTSTWPPIDKG